MHYSFILMGALAAALTGCAVVPAADNSPVASTAVISSTSSFGGRIMPSVSGKETLYFRGDRKRSENDFQFENWMLKHSVGYFMSGGEEIIRLDKSLQWQLNKKEKTYTECPLGGCALPNVDFKSMTQGERGSATRQEDNGACKLVMKRNEYKVVSTADHRQIAGVDAKRYSFNWVVEMRDPNGKLATNTVTFDFWTADPQGTLKQVLAVEDAFTKNYVAALPASNLARNFLNKDVYAALGQLGVATGLKGDKWALNLGKELQKIKGYPLAVSVEWRAVDNSCKAPPAPPVQAAQSESSSVNPMDWLTKKATEKMVGTVDANEALLHYSFEISSVSINDEHDSVFEVPAGFALRQNKAMPASTP